MNEKLIIIVRVFIDVDEVCKDFIRNNTIDQNSKVHKSNDSKQIFKMKANVYVNNKPISGFQRTSFIEISNKGIYKTQN